MSDIVEDWMPIPGFSGYEAGSYGSIRKAGGSYAAMRLQRSRTGYLSVTLRPSINAGKVRIYPDRSLESALQSEER